jgi:hypothetical protein
MQVNISDLSMRPAGLNTDVSIDQMIDSAKAARTAELSLDEMRKHTGTGIYLMSAVHD